MNKRSGSCVMAFTLALGLAVSTAALAGAKYELKMATLAPKGTALAKVFEVANKIINEKTGGEVNVRFYFGGVQGDEKEMLQKIKIRQLHGGAFTFLSLWSIVPEVHVLSLPYTYANYDEYYYVREGIKEDLDKLFDKKGFKVLAWGDSGYAYDFSKVPLTSVEVARKQKFWMWGDDPISTAIFDAWGITPVSLSIVDVMSSLSSNLIDAASNTPAMAVAFRWHTKFKYVGERPGFIVGGAVVVSKSKWEKIPADYRKLIAEVVENNYNGYVGKLREDDAKAIKLLKKSGIKVVRASETPNVEKMSKEVGEKVREGLVGKLYSRELLDKAMGLLADYRKKHPNPKIEKID